LPNYTVVETSGEPHDQHFKVSCELRDINKQFFSEGSSRKVAEQRAAQHALDDLN